jgi:hypothetical protein
MDAVRAGTLGGVVVGLAVIVVLAAVTSSPPAARRFRCGTAAMMAEYPPGYLDERRYALTIRELDKLASRLEEIGRTIDLALAPRTGCHSAAERNAAAAKLRRLQLDKREIEHRVRAARVRCGRACR